MTKLINIAIEGPVASGKGTVAWELSKKLGYKYLDTGAMYRSIAYVCQQAGIDKLNEKAISDYVKDVKLIYTNPTAGSSERCAIFINDHEVTPFIRSAEISNYSSYCGGYQIVRNKVTEVQRQMIAEKGVVVEGQAMIDEIMPDAEVKIYLTADEETRAHRRWQDHLKRGDNHSYEEVLEALRQRDLHDSTKEIGRRKIHPEATVIDSTNLTPQQVIELIYNMALQKIND